MIMTTNLDPQIVHIESIANLFIAWDYALTSLNFRQVQLDIAPAMSKSFDAIEMIDHCTQ